jgi:Trp operon repressor
MDCPELSALEALLSRFNIFRILRAARHEIRHSNMLAWLLTPDENHGLGDGVARLIFGDSNSSSSQRR